MKTRKLESTNITWTQFIEMIQVGYVEITTDEWCAILGNGITGNDTLLKRIKQFFDAKPVIGFTMDNTIVLRANVDLKTEVLIPTWAWVTSMWLGTYTGTTTNILTVDTTRMVPNNITPTFKEFLGLTTDDLNEVPLIHFTHEATHLTRNSYLYCNGQVKPTPLPDGATFLTSFKLVNGNKTNAVEAVDQDGKPFSGTFDLTKMDVTYDAVTVTENVPTN